MSMVLLLFILGVCVGSFLNVLADRLPKGEDVFWGRSHCDFCKHKLLWYELVPLLSFFFQRGMSRCCKKRISFQYPLVELITGIGFVAIYGFQIGKTSPLLPPSSYLLPLSLYLTLFSSFLVIFVSDLKYEIIPIEMLIVGFLAALFFHFINLTNLPRVDASQGGLYDFTNFLLSASGSGLFFFTLWFFTKGKAMGDGDIYLAVLIGFLLGFPDIVVALYSAFLTGATIGIILVLGRIKSLKAHIPFGPFLIAGYGITIVWGEKILQIWRLLW